MEMFEEMGVGRDRRRKSRTFFTTSKTRPVIIGTR